MNKQDNSAITLIEILIGVVILGVIVLGMASIDSFTNYHFFSSDRRAKVQNDVSVILDHMNKEITRAIGNELINGANTVLNVNPFPSGDSAIRVYIDASGNGQREAPQNGPAANEDHTIYYRLNTSGATQEFEFCQIARRGPENANSTNCLSGQDIVLGTSITELTILPTPTTFNASGQLQENHIRIRLTGCWDPDGTPYACGEAINPTVSMETTVVMPSVSVN